jgi:hypothetical protein
LKQYPLQDSLLDVLELFGGVVDLTEFRRFRGSLLEASRAGVGMSFFGI